MKVTTHKNILIGTTMALLLFCTTSCKKYLETGAPINQVGSADVFKTDASAISAVSGLYNNSNFSATSGFMEYSLVGAVTFLTGMASDEVYDVYPYYESFRLNTYTVADSYNNNIWNFGYAELNFINNAIEGLTASTGVSAANKSQLLGECYTLRALCHFYLTNLYGDVPLVTTTSVALNANMPRTPQATVYAQIVTDLTLAQSLLTDAYPAGTTLRIRINKAAATALLARVYLYQKNWAGAESQASAVIGNSAYSLSSLDNTFINTSTETIWQLFTFYGYNQFGNNFVPSGTTPEYVIYKNLENSFEATDQRKAKWLKTGVNSGVTYYYPYKYKLRSNVTTGNEYTVMFRLSEQYLIRAEARAQQSKLTGAGSATEDLTVIRAKAGLLPISATDQPGILLAIENERYHELFTESGQRWLDLKRTNRADAVLGPQKPTWKSTSALLPIPSQQITVVPALTQNPGY